MYGSQSTAEGCICAAILVTAFLTLIGGIAIIAKILCYLIQ